MSDGRILVVDDETDLAESCKRLLLSRGYQARAAASGEEAVELIQEFEPDLVITDLRMPGMSGMELLGRARQLRPDAQVIMATAYSTVEDAVAAFEARMLAGPGATA